MPYNRLEGDPCCGSDRLLMQILRQDWDMTALYFQIVALLTISIGKKDTKHIRMLNRPLPPPVLSGTDLECGFQL